MVKTIYPKSQHSEKNKNRQENTGSCYQRFVRRIVKDFARPIVSILFMHDNFTVHVECLQHGLQLGSSVAFAQQELSPSGFSLSPCLPDSSSQNNQNTIITTNEFTRKIKH